MTVPDPTATRPGSPEALELGCTCAQKVPRLQMEGDRLRTIHDVDSECPVHGLDVMKAWLESEGT